MGDPRFHFVSMTVRGEACVLCGEPATHKIGEAIPPDDPFDRLRRGVAFTGRHPFTEYVCCAHFRSLFGPAVFCLEPPNG